MRTLPLTFVPTRCAICDSLDNADEVYAASFDATAFNPAVFSARRLPDRIHYRVVRCATCGLVRSDPIAETAVLHDLYARSSFDYAREVARLRTTYGRYLHKLVRFGADKGALLEIGGGSGFFLEEARAQGYVTVKGIEPSQAAIDQAAASIKPHLVCDVMRPGLYAPASFDVICLFHVFDHLPDPGAVLHECVQLLRPGGLILCICHDVEASSARLLRERSPIIDVEHTYLFSQKTASRLFRDQGFVVRSAGPVWNAYPIRYLVRLVPLVNGLKSRLLSWLNASRLGGFQLTLPLGNLYIIAQRPGSGVMPRVST